MEYYESGVGRPNKAHPNGKPYPHKVTMGNVGGVTISISDGWQCGGIGIALSGAINVDQLPQLVELLNPESIAEAVTLLKTGKPKPAAFIPDSSGAFVPSSPAALQDERLVGVPVDATGDLPGVGRVRVISTEGHYKMA